MQICESVAKNIHQAKILPLCVYFEQLQVSDIDQLHFYISIK